MHPNDGPHEVSADEIDEGTDASGSVSGEAALDTVAGLDGVTGSVSTVDQLEGRLSQIQGAMDHVQGGDLDTAEASIATLEANATAGGDEE